MTQQIQEGVFDNFFIKIGADTVWENYEKQYERYTRSRQKCQTQPSNDKLKECTYIVDLKILMLKIKSLRQASSYCRNSKDPAKCRRRLAKIIERANEQMRLKRDALKKLHDKMDEKRREEYEHRGKTKENVVRAI